MKEDNFRAAGESVILVKRDDSIDNNILGSGGCAGWRQQDGGAGGVVVRVELFDGEISVDALVIGGGRKGKATIADAACCLSG